MRISATRLPAATRLPEAMRLQIRRLAILGVVLAASSLAVCVWPLFAQETSADSSGGREAVGKELPKKDSGAKVAADRPLDKKRLRPAVGPLPALTADNEAAALKFVDQHHTELASLVRRLKEKRPEEYKRAMRELYRTSEQLAQARATDQEKFELELDIWKTDSEIRLLAAKLTMGDQAELESQLRNQIAKKHKLQVGRLEMEKRRVEQRLKKIDESIARVKQNQEATVQRQLDELLRVVQKDRKRPRTEKANNDAAKNSPAKNNDSAPERAEPIAPK